MRFLLRLLGGIWIAILLVTVGFTWLEVREERTRLLTDIERRGALAAELVREASERVVGRRLRAGYDRLITRFGSADRVIALYDELGGLLATSAEAKAWLGVISPSVTRAIHESAAVRGFHIVGGRMTWVHVVPLMWEDKVAGAAAILVDAQYLESREWTLWQRTAVRVGILILLLTGITWLVVRWSLTHPMAQMAEWTKQLKSGHPVPPPPTADASLFGSLAHEVTGLARTLTRARTAAAYEAQLRLRGESVWTEERLKQFVKMRFGDRPIFVVSNREPVSHVKDGGRIRTITPASGLVTALEPIMVACGGVWVAHGSGDADMEVGARVGLPPDNPTYALRRVWLTPEEEAGYYYGFANEGLWPLCHIVHERPQFLAGDWDHYRAVNAKFADALVEEMAGTEEPIVLVQDYHFALLPRLLKAARPDARIALFWHIPWPNFEAFRICPWQQDILLGMLGADLVGFHTQFHCNNFLETVERTLEGRVEWDRFAVIRGGHTTLVQPFPISVAPELEVPREVDRGAALRAFGPEIDWLGIGVERIDYTKGLPERFRAIRRFFERWPEYRRRVTFVQIGSPSRGRIPRYQALQAEIHATLQEINGALGEADWLPIVYRERHHEPEEIRTWFRCADFCMVTSLHDGMNLVAKEFVASRDGDGALILSRFAGAANELSDALLVNPYDIDDVAAAIHRAITMDVAERRSRMLRMKAQVDENNVYRWAAMLLAELDRMPRAAALAAREVL
jgi:trehalose 6-phosphate synthase